MASGVRALVGMGLVYAGALLMLTVVGMVAGLPVFAAGVGVLTGHD